jgi:hypothetical protein
MLVVEKRAVTDTFTVRMITGRQGLGAAPIPLMKDWMRKTHLGPLGMILSMIDTSRRRALVYNWRYLAGVSIIAIIVLWFLVVHGCDGFWSGPRLPAALLGR